MRLVDYSILIRDGDESVMGSACKNTCPGITLNLPLSPYPIRREHG